jgi:hypothetical protein
MEWIKCIDRMPPIDEKVLVYQKGGVHGGCEIDIEYLMDDHFWSDQGVFSTITHWMPLPNKPESYSENLL